MGQNKCHLCEQIFDTPAGMRVAMIGFTFGRYNTPSGLMGDLCPECEQTFVEVFRAAKNKRREQEYQKSVESFLDDKVEALHKSRVHNRLSPAAASSGSVSRFVGEYSLNYHQQKPEQIHFRFMERRK